jgi:hypothetical protein
MKQAQAALPLSYAPPATGAAGVEPATNLLRDVVPPAFAEFFTAAIHYFCIPDRGTTRSRRIHLRRFHAFDAGVRTRRGQARFTNVFPAAFVLILCCANMDWRQDRRNRGACAPALYSLSYDQNLAAVWRPGIEPGDLLVICDVVPSAFAKLFHYCLVGRATRVARRRDTVSDARILGPRFPRMRCSPASIRTKLFQNLFTGAGPVRDKSIRCDVSSSIAM